MTARFWGGAVIAVAAVVLCAGVAEAKEVDWSALNPEYREATFVKDTGVCLGCHEEVHAAYAETAHGKAFRFNPRNALQALDCEACHGPRSKHIEDPDDRLALRTLAAAQRSAVCLQCHQDGGRMHWGSGAHQAAGQSCSDCHSVMRKRSDKGLLSAGSEQAVCYTCHANVRAEAQKASHHPIREGKIRCSDCHNPHGSVNRGMLAGGSVNQTCYSCHQEKRGPFLWEHAPVRESCLTCHTPHGSNNRDLLNLKGPAQCISCHQYGGHINQFRYNRVSTPYGKGCVNCHVTVHGSNHPSGAKFNR
jgi:DmsE family decaheme c-type cytochrome